MVAALPPLLAQPAVVINEIHYHPVEEPAFNADGSPVMDLYHDVHEFLELFNPGTEAVSLQGWELAGGIEYHFSSNAVIQPKQFLVIAKNPARLAAVAAYGLTAGDLLGPYDGQLGNNNDTIRLRDANHDPVDAVSYSGAFPWAISADALGAGPDFTGLDPADHQYRGRSLERVSITHPANDPANWLASPLPGNPSPGRSNAVSRLIPKPVVIHFSAQQQADEAALIRAGQPALLSARFSGTNQLANVRIEWFVDNVNQTNEQHTITAMNPEGLPADARFSVVLPGQADRGVVRYRFLADRGEGLEVVSPRADDPYAWHAYFVSPVRTSTYPIYDVFISSASLTILNTNISQSPRRVTSPDPPGYPRESWNATQPAIFVHDGVVYDIHLRHHGSRYNRSAGRYSLKLKFPRYRLFNGYQGIFETDKGDAFVIGHGLFQAAGLPTSKVRYVDLHLNDTTMRRLEQEEMDDRLLERFYAAQELRNPGLPPEEVGEFYKSVGVIGGVEGPYDIGDERRLTARSVWTTQALYEWTYTIQSAEWKRGYYITQMIEGLWNARGDTHSNPNPNIPALRAWLEQNFDIDKTLTYLAVLNWMCPWDDTTQNHFLWQQRNGRWSLLPWDFDSMYGSGDNTPATASIYMGEVGDPNNNFRGPNFLKDSFFKAFREEYKQQLFLLNTPLLHPDNIRALGYGAIGSFADARFASVNAQCGYGTFQRPQQPTLLAPGNGITALPPLELRSSAYGHSASPAPAHASTTWEIRAATGSYDLPVFKITTTTNLTSLPIPFASLEFGQTYSWRCTHTDANGHPSLASAESSFNFGPSSSVVTLIGLDATTQWRYNQTEADPAGWKDPDFNADGWPSGAALFYVENSALPDTKRTPLSLGRTTYYFRTEFDFPYNPDEVTLHLQHIVDDGLVVYLNGTPIYRVSMPESGVTYSTLATYTVGDAIAEGPFDIHTSALVQGRNVLAVEVHQCAAGSTDIVFGLSLQATVPAVAGNLVINEIAAVNQGSVTLGSTTPDWLELFNASSQAVDLGGMRLTDDILQPDRYVFPSNTVLAAQDHLTVWCDDATTSPGLHTGFGLKADGQTVVLLSRQDTSAVIHDAVTYGLQLPDLTIGRYPSGSDNWTLTTPTRNAPNQPQALGSPDTIKFNEWMASPNTGDDWLELHNPDPLPVDLGGLCLTDDLGVPINSRLAALSFLAGNGFVKLIADGNPENGADHLDFKLSANGETIGLFAANGTTLIDSITFGTQSAGTSQGRLPDGAATIVSFSTTHSPGESNYLPLDNVVIHEVLTHSDPPLEDAIELHNPTTTSVDLSGWYLSDSRDQLRKYCIPAGTILPPGGYTVFYEYQFNADTNSPSSFSLSSARGDQVHLSAATADGSELLGYRASVDFGPAENGVTFGHYLTSVGADFTALSSRTLGADAPSTVAEFRLGTGLPNALPKVGPVVISEIQYHPPDLGTNDNTLDEFVELLNITGAPVPLYDPSHPTNTWQLDDAVEFTFPTGIALLPGQPVLVVGFDPQTNAAALAEFRATYSLSETATIFGPYAGKLDNSAESVELFKPDSPQTDGPDAGLVPYVLVDRVHYRDLPPWPPAADGTGASLQRLNVAAYGNEPTNWTAATPTPAQATSSGDQDGDGLPDDWEITYGTAVDVPDADADPDGDNLTNLEEYWAGTHPGDPASNLRLEIVAAESGSINLRFEAVAGHTYHLQHRDSLTPADWLLLESIPAPQTNGLVIVTDEAPSETRFYRVATP